MYNNITNQDSLKNIIGFNLSILYIHSLLYKYVLNLAKNLANLSCVSKKNPVSLAVLTKSYPGYRLATNPSLMVQIQFLIVVDCC